MAKVQVSYKNQNSTEQIYLVNEEVTVSGREWLKSFTLDWKEIKALLC